MTFPAPCPRCPEQGLLRQVADFQEPYDWYQCDTCNEIYLRRWVMPEQQMLPLSMRGGAEGQAERRP
jgi:hypothetical protein